MKIDKVLKKPLITEKSLAKAKDSVYVFQVDMAANKNQIKQAVEKLFEVDVSSVRVIVRRGKVRKVGRRMREKKLPNKKIAYVKVAKGKIDLFPRT